MATRDDQPIVSIELSEQKYKLKPSHVAFSSKDEKLPGSVHGIGSKHKKNRYDVTNHTTAQSESSESPTESDHYLATEGGKGGKGENGNHSETSPLLTDSLNFSARFDNTITSVSFQVSAT